MLKNKNFLVALLIMLFVANCSTKGRGKLDELNVPEWVLNPYAKNVGADLDTEIAGVGIAKDCGDLAVEIAEAEHDARVKIAEQIEVNIDAQIESAVDKSTVAGKADLKKTFKSNAKSLINVSINGAMRKAIYKDKGDKDVASNTYVLLFVSKKEAMNRLKEDLARKFKDKSVKEVIDKIN